jgi:hypothetical protein
VPDPAKPPHGETDGANPTATDPAHPAHGDVGGPPAGAHAGGDAPGTPGPQAAQAAALDTTLSDLGYPAGTRAKGTELAGRIEQGEAPPRGAVRDTVANQQGLRDLDQIRTDPRLAPAQKAKLQREIATGLRGQPEPTGKLPRDIQDARARSRDSDPTPDPSRPSGSSGLDGAAPRHARGPDTDLGPSSPSGGPRGAGPEGSGPDAGDRRGPSAQPGDSHGAGASHASGPDAGDHRGASSQSSGGPRGAHGPAPESTGAGSAPDGVITAANVPGSSFHRTAGGRADAAHNRQVAQDRLAPVAESMGLVGGHPVHVDGHDFVAFRAPDGGEVKLRVESGPLESGAVAETRLDLTRDQHVIRVSDRARPADVERAVAHEIGEVIARRSGASATGDALAAGVTPGPDARLSAHDHGRIAELEVLSRELAAAGGDAPEIRRELLALLDHLGLTGDNPGAQARLDLAVSAGGLSGETLDTVRDLAGSQDRGDAAALADIRATAAQHAADARAADTFRLDGAGDTPLHIDPDAPDRGAGAVADYLAAKAGVEPGRVQAELLAGGATGALLYKIRIGDADLGVFKVFPDADEATVERDLLDRLNRAGFEHYRAVRNRTDQPVLTDTGGAGMLMDAARGQSVAARIKDLPSEPARREPALHELERNMQQVARALAEMHTITGGGPDVRMTGAARRNEAGYIRDKLIDPRTRRQLGPEADAVIAAYDREVAAFLREPVPRGAYHGDANAGNFMIAGDRVDVIDVSTMEHSIDPGRGGIVGTRTGTTDVARFRESLETLAPGALSPAELTRLRDAFDAAYAAASGVDPTAIEAGRRIFAVETQLATLRANLGDPEAAERAAASIKEILGTPAAAPDPRVPGRRDRGTTSGRESFEIHKLGKNGKPGKVIGRFTRGDQLELVGNDELFGGNVIELEPGRTTAIVGRHHDVVSVKRRGQTIEGDLNGVTAMGDNPGGINAMGSPEWPRIVDEVTAEVRAEVGGEPDPAVLRVRIAERFWDEVNLPWIVEAAARGDAFRLVSDPEHELSLYYHQVGDGGLREFLRDDDGQRIASIYARELDILRDFGYVFLPDGKAVKPEA